jgi:hypothetical protein
MNRYITYQCTVCRRTKDVERDNLRAIPTGCTITKGCGGTLFKVGDKGFAEQTVPVAGVTDWHPRGTSPVSGMSVKSDELIKISNSSSGALVLAVKFTTAQATATSQIILKLEQRRVEAIPFTQFTFRVLTKTDRVSGRDSQGKNLRIDSTAEAEGRLLVRVNGVQRSIKDVTGAGTLSATIELTQELEPQSVVDVIVFNEREVQEQELRFATNRTIAVNDLSGAWGNVRFVDKVNPLIDAPFQERYWLYTCTSTSQIPASSRIRVVSLNGVEDIPIEDAAFLLSSEPHTHVDRYVNLLIPLSVCQDGFNILTSSTPTRDFTVERNLIQDVYPPLRIRRGYTPQTQSLTSADVIPENSGAIPTDTPKVLLTNKYVNGPV